ncbi:MAG: hypothetical protein GY801_26710 [bacterium]|nr:hypothetical protein [bacterium]
MTYKQIVAALFFFILLFPNVTVIAQEQEKEDLEKRAGELYELIMCPICSGQTIAQSTSEISIQMQNLVLKKLRQGETKEEILQYFTSRYGEWILAKPTKKGLNLMLWFLPSVSLFLAIIVIYSLIRHWTKKVPVETVTYFEEAEMAKYKERLEKELQEFDE